jgi:hypothetical protein
LVLLTLLILNPTTNSSRCSPSLTITVATQMLFRRLAILALPPWNSTRHTNSQISAKPNSVVLLRERLISALKFGTAHKYPRATLKTGTTHSRLMSLTIIGVSIWNRFTSRGFNGGDSYNIWSCFRKSSRCQLERSVPSSGRTWAISWERRIFPSGCMVM